MINVTLDLRFTNRVNCDECKLSSTEWYTIAGRGSKGEERAFFRCAYTGECAPVSLVEDVLPDCPLLGVTE